MISRAIVGRVRFRAKLRQKEAPPLFTLIPQTFTARPSTSQFQDPHSSSARRSAFPRRGPRLAGLPSRISRTPGRSVGFDNDGSRLLQLLRSVKITRRLNEGISAKREEEKNMKTLFFLFFVLKFRNPLGARIWRSVSTVKASDGRK